MSKKFEPTQEQRDKVRRLLEDGYPQFQVNKQIINPETGKAIADKTFSLAFEEEIAQGNAIAVQKMERVLWDQATSGGPGSAALIIFYLKTRGGWKETNVTQIETPNGQPFNMSATFASKEELEEAVKKVMKSVG